MRIIDLTQTKVSLDEALMSASQESLLIKRANGERFIISPADDLATEVELLRRNNSFVEFLDSCKEDKTAVSLDEVEKRLR